MENVQAAASPRSHRRAPEAQKVRGRSRRPRNKNRAENGSQSASASRSGKHVRAISPFYADFADAFAAHMNFVGFRITAPRLSGWQTSSSLAARSKMQGNVKEVATLICHPRGMSCCTASQSPTGALPNPVPVKRNTNASVVSCLMKCTLAEPRETVRLRCGTS